MYKLIRWLIGYVSFSFYSGFSEGFINDCYSKKLNIKNVTVKDGTLYAECPSLLYPYLRSTARKNGGRLRINEKHGALFSLSKIKNRWGIFVGIVLGIIFISYISGFVWNIEITGNKTLGEGELRSFLSDNGFTEGVRWRDADRDKIENLLLASFDKCAFAHINRNGTSATLEIDEAVEKPKTVNRKKYANLKAKKSGIIVKATVYDGWAVRNRGDAVTKGDLLISGIYSGEKKVTLYTHARGEYIARVKEKFSLTVNRNQSYKKYLSEIERKSILFFGLKIPLYIGKTPKNAEVTTSNSCLVLNGKELPLGIQKCKIKTYKNEVRTLSDRELNALCESEVKKELDTDFSDYKIIKTKLSTELLTSCAKVTGYVICHEDIGEEVRIRIKKNK